MLERYVVKNKSLDYYRVHFIANCERIDVFGNFYLKNFFKTVPATQTVKMVVLVAQIQYVPVVKILRLIIKII